MPKYILDTNTFIRAKNAEYQMNVHVKFWEWIDQETANGLFAASMQVYSEILEKDDELADWARARKDSGLFLEPTEAVQKTYTDIADYVNRTYKPHHAKWFLGKADAWTIALAKDGLAEVVTHEKEENTEKVKIPNICKQFLVPCKNIYMIQAILKPKF